jgi:hypothetical protein
MGIGVGDGGFIAGDGYLVWDSVWDGNLHSWGYGGLGGGGDSLMPSRRFNAGRYQLLYSLTVHWCRSVLGRGCFVLSRKVPTALLFFYEMVAFKFETKIGFP